MHPQLSCKFLSVGWPFLQKVSNPQLGDNIKGCCAAVTNSQPEEYVAWGFGYAA